MLNNSYFYRSTNKWFNLVYWLMNLGVIVVKLFIKLTSYLFVDFSSLDMIKDGHREKGGIFSTWTPYLLCSIHMALSAICPIFVTVTFGCWKGDLLKVNDCLYFILRIVQFVEYKIECFTVFFSLTLLVMSIYNVTFIL